MINMLTDNHTLDLQIPHLVTSDKVSVCKATPYSSPVFHLTKGVKNAVHFNLQKSIMSKGL